MQRESISQTTFAKGVGAVAILAASLGTLAYTEYSPNAVNHNFVPGTYTADAQGMDGPVTVTITVDDSTITEVSVDVSGETAGIGAEIGDTVTSQIMESQSSLIDGVAGATVSSTAVKDALDAAIAKAESGDTSVPEKATEAAPEEAAPAEEPAISYGSYTPGTYTASAQGMESEVSVTATFDETAITDVSLDVSGETQGIGAAAGDALKEAILAAQSVEFDGVSGATVTSTAAKTALTDIFAQATGGAGESVAEAAAEAAEEAVSEAAADSASAGNSYTASAQGIESEVKVTGTFDGASLVGVDIDVSGETAGLGAEVGGPLSEAFLAAQSADVDGVAGATVTSDAVKSAMADVFAQAAGGAGESVAEAVTEAAEEVDAAAITLGSYVPGTYTASAAGKESDVTVTATFDETSLTDISIDVSGETKNIGDAIGERMQDAVLAAQSYEVDGVTGATVTSDAVKASLLDIFAQASGGEAAEAVTEAAEEETAAVSTEDAVTDIPEGYGVAVLPGSGETADVTEAADTADAQAPVIDETKDGVGVAEKN